MLSKHFIATGLMTSVLSGPLWAATSCQQPDRDGAEIELSGGRRITVVEQTIVDSSAQSTLRQKLLIERGQLTQEESRTLLAEMFARAKAVCRKNALHGAVLFLYGSRDTVVGSNWLARLDTGSGMTPTVDVHPSLLAGGSKSCEGVVPPKYKGKEYRSPGEVNLPPINQRKVLGTWFGMKVFGATCSRSFELVNGRAYEVLRCSDCGGGTSGTPLVKRADGTFVRPDRRHGEYFKILPNGDLAAYDKDGHIDTARRLEGLWPQDR